MNRIPRKRRDQPAAANESAKARVPVRLVVIPAELLHEPPAELRGAGRPLGVLDARPRSIQVLEVLRLLVQKKTVGQVASALGRPYPTVYAIMRRWLHRPNLQLSLPTG